MCDGAAAADAAARRNRHRHLHIQYNFLGFHFHLVEFLFSNTLCRRRKCSFARVFHLHLAILCVHHRVSVFVFEGGRDGERAQGSHFFSESIDVYADSICVCFMEIM